MSRFPEDVKYSMQHLWLRLSDGRDVRVGVTDHWTEHLGILVHIELPQVGTVVQAGDQLGELVGPTASEPIVAPVSGTISATNQMLVEQPETARTEAYGDGWLFEVELPEDHEPGELPLLDAAGYEELVQQ